ncbi:MAG: leucine-rich repeat protein, partial [Wujia sp.]
IFWYDEENDTEELCEGFGFDSEKGEYTCEDPDISFYPNATEPWYALKNVDDLASVSVSGNKLVVQVNAIGDYILTDGGSGCYGFRVDLPNLGVYTSTDRKMNKYDVVENWPHSIQAYKGRTSEEMYVLGWIDPEHYDENGVAKEDIDPWATDPASIKIHAGENVQWTWEDGNPVKYTEIENFIRVDEDNPVKYANGAVYGYPITLTDAIDRDFSIIMSHERIGKDRTEECGSGIAETHYDQLDVTYISLKELKVKTAPTKVEYIEGATFDPSGLVVEAVYEDGKTFELTKEEYEISIGDKSVTDKLATTDKAVTISYLGKTVEQPITVNEKTKVDLSKAAWNYTEAFTADGTEKKVEITGLPTDVVNVEYKNNKASAVGTYTAEAVITLKDESAYQFASEIPASLKSLAWEIKAPQTTPEPTPTTPTTPEPTPTAPTTPETPAGTIKAGDTATVKGSSYKVTSVKNNKKTVTYTAGDKKATKITVPATVTINGTVYKVTAIADKAFSGCSKLTTVTISSNVISIGKNAFSGCKKLTKVTIGKNVKTIGANAFSGCSKLKTLSMGANVTTIGDKAFYKCTALTKVTIPAKVSKIGKQAFYGCKNLKSITIKTTKLNSKNVGSNAFKGIYAKAAIKVPKSKLTSYTEVLKAKGVSSKAEIKK